MDDTLILAYLTKEERMNMTPEEYHKILADHKLKLNCPVCKNWSQADHDIEYDHECVKPAGEYESCFACGGAIEPKGGFTDIPENGLCAGELEECNDESFMCLLCDRNWPLSYESKYESKCRPCIAKWQQMRRRFN
jgi:hypothetical protein